MRLKGNLGQILDYLAQKPLEFDTKSTKAFDTNKKLEAKLEKN